MPVLSAKPRFRIVKTPKGDERLKGFCCGTREKWERDINSLVERQYTGTAHYRPTVIAMLSSSHDVLGLSGFRPRAVEFPIDPAPETEPAYVHLIGLSQAFRGWRLPDEKTRLGDALLAGTLKKIAVEWPGDKMPAV